MSCCQSVTMERRWATLFLIYFLVQLIGHGDASLGNHRHIKYVSRQYDIKKENNLTIVEPPPHELVAKMARYIVHKSGNITPYKEEILRNFDLQKNFL